MDNDLKRIMCAHGTTRTRERGSSVGLGVCRRDFRVLLPFTAMMLLRCRALHSAGRMGLKKREKKRD